MTATSVQERNRFRLRSLSTGLVIGLLITIVSFGPQRTAAASSSPSLKVVAKQLLAVINADRAKLHVPSLVLDSQQSTCSKRHSVHMAVMGTIAHDQFPSDICVAHTIAGENVGYSGGDPLTAVMTLNTSMMNEGPCPDKPCPPSEFHEHGHYMNLVNPAYKHIGIGIVVRDTTVWLTEDFAG